MNRLLKNGIKIFALLIIVLLGIYLIRFQLFGYRINCKFNTSEHEAREILQQFSPIVEAHAKTAFCWPLSLQSIYWSENECVLEYSNYDKKYVLTIIYVPGQTEAKLQITRSLKLRKPRMNYLSWNYGIAYFSNILGTISSYSAQSNQDQDMFFFNISGNSYRASPVTGEYFFLG